MESEPTTSAAGEAVLPPEGVPQIPSQYDSERGLFVAGQNSGNVINFSPNITQTVGSNPENASNEPRRIEINDVSSPDETTATSVGEPAGPAAPEVTSNQSESARLQTLLEQVLEERRQDRQMMERMVQALEANTQLMQRLMDRLDGQQATDVETKEETPPQTADTPIVEQPLEEPSPVEAVEEPEPSPGRPYDHEIDGGVADTSGETENLTTEAETAEQQYEWNPREGDQVSVMAANGAYENDWRIDKITGEGDDRRIRAIRGYATGGTPQEQIEDSYQTFLSWQIGAGKLARRKSEPEQTAPVATSTAETEETKVYPAREGVMQQQEQEPVQEQDNSMRGRMGRVWDRTKYVAMWPFNRAYEYFYLAEDPAVRRRRGLSLLAAGMIVASAVTAYFAQKHGIHTGSGGNNGILPGNASPEHGAHGPEHMSFIDQSVGHRRTGGMLPEGLDWGHDGSGHEIIVNNHGATVVGADQLPHGIMKANGALSTDAVSALRKAGYSVGYVRMDNITASSGNLYAPVVS